MEIKVEILSKELIKPSSPTPLHLRKHKFSKADQNQPAVSMPFVCFYEKSNNITNLEKFNLLKKSLSNILAIFYPLAGRINNYSYVDCNDEGALFIEMKANCQLSDILQNRNQYHKLSKYFIPLQPHSGVHQYGSLFQITYFNCGGLAVTFAAPHMLGDALSQSTFLKSWAAIARGETIDIPSFDSASIFPPEKSPKFDVSELVFKENVVTKLFVFDASTISGLKDKYSTNDAKVSRVQALCIFILRIIASIGRAKEGGKKNRFLVFNQVNVRPLLGLPKQLFGNIVISTTTEIDIGKENEIPRRILDSFTRVNLDYVKEVQGRGEPIFVSETFSPDWLKGDMDKYIFSSLCNIPIYEMSDFGWGKPEWMAGSGMGVDNLIHFTDTNEGRGIDVWISLIDKDMAKFEKDEVLLSHLSSVPNRNPNFDSRL